MAVFSHRNEVMFQHCDPAGIVFYPRYFEMINAAVESFFARAVDWPFSQMHGKERLGVPMGRISADFHAPSRLGDLLDWNVSIRRLGAASARFAIGATAVGERRVTCEATVVLVSLGEMKSRRWPEPVRARLLQFVEE